MEAEEMEAQYLGESDTNQFDWTLSVITTATLVNFLGVGWDWVHLVRRPLPGLLY
jgi:hypothetical protein